MNKQYKVISSSPDSSTERFRGTKEECEQWIKDNKNRFPGYVTLKTQPAEESAKWGRDFDIHSGGSVYEKMNKIDDSRSLNDRGDVKNHRKMRKLKESGYSDDEMTEFFDWIQDYNDGALWDDFTAEFDSEEDPSMDEVLSWLEGFDEDAYYAYLESSDDADDIDAYHPDIAETVHDHIGWAREELGEADIEEYVQWFIDMSSEAFVTYTSEEVEELRNILKGYLDTDDSRSLNDRGHRKMNENKSLTCNAKKPQMNEDFNEVGTYPYMYISNTGDEYTDIMSDEEIDRAYESGQFSDNMWLKSEAYITKKDGSYQVSWGDFDDYHTANSIAGCKTVVKKYYPYGFKWLKDDRTRASQADRRISTKLRAVREKVNSKLYSFVKINNIYRELSKLKQEDDSISPAIYVGLENRVRPLNINVRKDDQRTLLPYTDKSTSGGELPHMGIVMYHGEGVEIPQNYIDRLHKIFYDNVTSRDYFRYVGVGERLGEDTLLYQLCLPAELTDEINNTALAACGLSLVDNKVVEINKPITESYATKQFEIPNFNAEIIDEFEDEGVKGYNIVYSKNGTDIVEVEVWEIDSPVAVNRNLHTSNLMQGYYSSFDAFASDLEYKTSRYVRVHESADKKSFSEGVFKKIIETEEKIF